MQNSNKWHFDKLVHNDKSFIILQLLKNSNPREQTSNSHNNFMLSSKKKIDITNNLKGISKNIENNLYLYDIDIIFPSKVMKSYMSDLYIKINILVHLLNLFLTHLLCTLTLTSSHVPFFYYFLFIICL